MTKRECELQGGHSWEDGGVVLLDNSLQKVELCGNCPTRRRKIPQKSYRVIEEIGTLSASSGDCS